MKALVVGLGGIGQRHVRNLRTLRGNAIELLAWRSRGLRRVIDDRLQVESGADVEEKYGIRSFSRLEDALAEKPAIALICNPTSLRLEAATAAARAGCHLFLEKPISDRLEGTSELAREVKNRGLVVLVGYQLRFHPLLARFRDAVSSGILGKVCSVRCEIGEYLPGWHPYEDYRALYASRRELGGGVLVTQIHEFDYLYWLFGLPRRVFAVGGHLSRLEIDVEDSVGVQMEFALGSRRIPGHIQLDYLQRPAARSCAVVGDEGKASIDLIGRRFVRFGKEGNLEEEVHLAEFERNELFLSEMKHFLECIEHGAAPIVGFPEGMASLKMALAARESLESGRVVRLDGAGENS